MRRIHSGWFHRPYFRWLPLIDLRIMTVIVALGFGFPCVAARGQVTGLYNTGVDSLGVLIGDGDVDPHYKLIFSADPLYPGPDAVAVNNGNYPLGSSPDWLPNGLYSRWIGPRADPDRDQGNEPGEYIYRTTFVIAGITPAAIRLTGQWIADDMGSIWLNGVDTGVSTSGHLTAFEPFEIDSGFVTGVNTVDFRVQNGYLPTGLRVEIGALVVPEGSSLWLLVAGGLPFLALVVIRRARTQA